MPFTVGFFILYLCWNKCIVMDIANEKEWIVDWLEYNLKENREFAKKNISVIRYIL